ncbi:MAG: hypothetical protein H6509_10255 [Bryobacterales bacterium]|nr:hypothetical protein [Bryobacterales bacterium]
MNVDLGPEERAALEAMAAETGETPEEVVRRILCSALHSPQLAPRTVRDARRFANEGGIYVLRTGRSVSAELTDETLRQVREERSGYTPPR